MGDEIEKTEILMLRRSKHANESPSVNPEELMSELFVKLLPSKVTLKVSSCDEALLDETEPLLGQFPILVYKHWIVPKKYIWEFWSQYSNLDD